MVPVQRRLQLQCGVEFLVYEASTKQFYTLFLGGASSAPKAPPTPAPVISTATTTITTPSDTATPALTSASAVPRQPAATPDWAWVAQELQEIRKLLTLLP